jgi:hypothetical protein
VPRYLKPPKIQPEADPLVTDDVWAAAREFIRSAGDDGYVVGIDSLLGELRDKSDRFCVTPDMHDLLYLILALWDDPHIDQPESGWIDLLSRGCANL